MWKVKIMPILRVVCIRKNKHTLAMTTLGSKIRGYKNACMKQSNVDSATTGSAVMVARAGALAELVNGFGNRRNKAGVYLA